MDELIEKQTVVDTLMDMAITGECCVGNDPRSKQISKVTALKMIDKVKSIPAAENQKAHWVLLAGGRRKECSNCGAYNSSRYKAFCPNCGMEMQK